MSRPSLKSNRQKRYDTQKRGEKELNRLISQANTWGIRLLLMLIFLIIIGYCFPFYP